MQKFFKIGEISALYNIGVDSLRYYEEIGVINPERSSAGYRLYSINDIWRLNVIRDLRELGFGMEKIKEYLDCHSTDSTLDLLEEEKTAIEKKLSSLNKLKANVENRMKTILLSETQPLNEIILKEYPLRKCFSITEGYSDEHEMDLLIKRLINMDKNHFYIIGNNQIGTVISSDAIAKTDSLKYQSVFIISENGNDCLPEGTYLSLYYKGDYSQSKNLAVTMLNYAKKHGLTIIGNFLEILWIDIHTTSDISENLTELQIQVKKQ